MRTKFAAVAGAIALVAGALVGTAGAASSKTAKPKSFKFTDVADGAQLTPTTAAFKVHDSRLGNGAGFQVVKLDKTGLAGTDQEHTYYGNASAVSKGSFKLSVPDANGISTITGKGQDIGGTGKLKGFKSTYTYSGTFNTKTLVYHVVLKGKGTTK